MPDRKAEIVWLEQTLREIERKNDQCHCGRGPKKAETELCQLCEEEAQADIDNERSVKGVERIYSGDER